MSHFDDIENARFSLGLTDHLTHLLTAELIRKEDQTVYGIARQVQEQGRDSLSGKQEWIFKTKVYEPFCEPACELCGDNIGIEEAFDLEQGDLRTICFSCLHDISKRK